MLSPLRPGIHAGERSRRREVGTAARLPIREWGFHYEQMPTLRAMLRQLLAEERVVGPDVWLYTTMALPLPQEVRPRVVVYDCMDELSAIRGAPTQMVEREAELLDRADLVFTGGPSLYRARKDRHPNIHCFPSSVEAAHFGCAREPLPEPADQAGHAPGSASSGSSTSAWTWKSSTRWGGAGPSGRSSWSSRW